MYLHELKLFLKNIMSILILFHGMQQKSIGRQEAENGGMFS